MSTGDLPFGDGILRARDMATLGVSRKQIMELTRQGELLHIGRGLYSRPNADITFSTLPLNVQVVLST